MKKFLTSLKNGKHAVYNNITGRFYWTSGTEIVTGLTEYYNIPDSFAPLKDCTKKDHIFIDFVNGLLSLDSWYYGIMDLKENRHLLNKVFVRTRSCPSCRGEGEINCDHCGHSYDCPECDGSGSLYDYPPATRYEDKLFNYVAECYRLSVPYDYFFDNGYTELVLSVIPAATFQGTTHRQLIKYSVPEYTVISVKTEGPANPSITAPVILRELKTVS